MKKIFTLLFLIFLFNTIFCSHIFAQNNVSSISGGVVVASVNITNAKIVSQKDRDFVVSFNISNKVGAQPQVKYSVKLVKITPTNQSILDEKVYDNILSLGENMTISKTINYSVPASIPAGTYRLYVQSKNISGLILAIASLGNIKIVSSVSGFIEIVPGSCSYADVIQPVSIRQTIATSTEVSSTPTSDSGNSIIEIPTDISNASSTSNQTESFSIKCKVTSTFSNNITLHSNFITRDHSSFGSVVFLPASYSTKNFIIKKGTSNVSFEAPKATKPQNYNLSFYLTSTDGKITTNTISYDYIIAGDSGTIKNVIFDKTYYKVGDRANIEIFSQQTGTGTITAIIKNDKGISCSATTSTQVSSFSIKNLSIPIKKDCLNPKINVILSSGTNILDSQNFQTITSTNKLLSKKNISISIVTIIELLVIIAVLIAVIFIYKKRKNKIPTIIIFTIFSFGFLSSIFFYNVANAGTCEIIYCNNSPYVYEDNLAEWFGVCRPPLYWCSGTKVMRTYTSNVTVRQVPKKYLFPSCTVRDNCSYGCSGASNYTGVGLCDPRASVTAWADASQIREGSGTTIHWSSSYATGCTVNGNSIPTSGSMDTGPIYGSNSYDFKCTGTVGDSRTNVSNDSWVNIITYSSPTISNIQINPNPASYNGYTTISADVTNAGSCTVTGNGNTVVWGSSPSNINFYVTNLTATTTFEIACDGGIGGTVVSDVEVGVLPRPLLSVSMHSATTTVSKSSATTIYWNSTGADSCQINDNDVPTSGEMSSGNLTSTTTYTINCINNSPPEYLPSSLPEGAILAVDPGLIFPNYSSPGGYQVGQVVGLIPGINPNLPDPFLNGRYFETGWNGSVNIDAVDNPLGGVMVAELINGGEGYSVGDVAIIIGGTYEAQMEVAETDGPAGAIRNIDVVYPGYGYQVGDQLTVLEGDYNGIINVDSVDESGAVTGISIVNPGTGYISNNILQNYYNESVSGGSGSDLVVTVYSVYGTILSLTSTNPINPGAWYGLGYAPLVNLGGRYGGSNMSAAVNILQVGMGVPRSVSVANPGSGYVSGMPYLMDGPGNISVTVTNVQGATNNLTNPDQGTYATAESSSTSIVIGVQDELSGPNFRRFKINIPEITWDVTDATSCVLKNEAGEILSIATSGTIIDYTLSTGHTFTLECSGPGGTSSASAICSFPESSSTCFASQIGDIYVNTNTKWTTIYNGTGTISSTIWSGDDILDPITTNEPELYKIYTTVGEKTIHAASTITGAGDLFTSYCSTSTIIKLDKGTINEI